LDCQGRFIRPAVPDRLQTRFQPAGRRPIVSAARTKPVARESDRQLYREDCDGEVSMKAFFMTSVKSRWHALSLLRTWEDSTPFEDSGRAPRRVRFLNHVLLVVSGFTLISVSCLPADEPKKPAGLNAEVRLIDSSKIMLTLLDAAVPIQTPHGKLLVPL